MADVSNDQFALPKKTVDGAMALLEALRPLCRGNSHMVVHLALAVRLAELLVEQTQAGQETDPRLVLVGILAFIGHVVESYYHLTGQVLPPFNLAMVSKLQTLQATLH